ncbi:MAG: bifunctional DNA primase/polymerase [Dehalococcoidia bacterium]|jgi:hypothetical protein
MGIFINTLEAARGYVRRGWSVVPLGDDKYPIISWKVYQERTPTDEELVEWFGEGKYVNVGIVTGRVSDLTVIDVEKGGDCSHFPPTLMVRTGGGGYHLYYRHSPGRGNAARIMPLTDIRGDGGQVVAPPSLHRSGNRYEFMNDMEIRPFPEHLFRKEIDLFATGVAHPPGVMLGEFEVELESASQGNRNTVAASACGKLMRFTRPYDWEGKVWPRMLRWNREQCEPQLTERELRSVFESVAKRAVNDQPAWEREIAKDTPRKPPSSVNVISWGEAMDMGYSELASTRPEDIVSYGYNFLDEALTGMMPGELPLFGGSTGCHEKGHPIRMWDGELKAVEKVMVGDFVMGPDGKSRKVGRLHYGLDKMIRVVPAEGQCPPFVVNRDHVFSVWLEENNAGGGSHHSRNGRHLMNIKASTLKRYVFDEKDLPRRDIWKLWKPRIPEYMVNRLNRTTLVKDSVRECRRAGGYYVDVTFDFTLEDAGVGEYYGFELEEGDRLYVDGYGICHHNSGKTTLIQNILRRADAAGTKVMLAALEDRVQDYAIRALYYRINEIAKSRGRPRYPWNAFRRNELSGDAFREMMDEARSDVKKCGMTLVTCDGRLSFRQLKELMARAVDGGYKVLCLDHLHHMDFEEGKGNKNDAIERFMVEAKHEINKNGLRLPIVAHYRKTNGELPTIESFKDSAALGQNASYVINLWRERGESASDAQKKGKETKMDAMKKIMADNSGRYVNTHIIVPKARNPNGEKHIVVQFDRERGDYVDTPKYGEERTEKRDEQRVDVTTIDW